MYTFKVENVSQRCKLLCSKKLKSVKFHICVFGTMKVFRRYIAYLKKNNLISFSYLSITFKLGRYEQYRFFNRDHIFRIFFDFY